MRSKTALLAIVLVAATWIVYQPAIRGPFLFDDVVATVENPTIRDLRAVGQVLSPPRNGSSVTGRPVVNASLAFNYAVGELNTYGYHAFNIFLHAASGLLLFGSVRRTLQHRDTGANGYPTAVAFAAALLWSLHPVQTESVACVIQRTELLVGFFYLLTLYCFIRSMDGPAGRIWAALSIIACLLGMTSKEVMVTAPVMMLLYDRTFRAGSFTAAWKQRRNVYLGLAGTWLLLMFLLFGIGGSRGTSAGFGIGISAWSYLLKQCEAIVRYVELAAWPHPLILDYGNDVVEHLADVGPQAAVVVLLLGATAVALIRNHALGFCGAWFFLILAPSSSFIPLVTQTMAEHRMYLPLASMIVPFVVSVAGVGGRRLAIAAALAVVAFGVIAGMRNVVLSNPLQLWADNAVKRPGNPRGYDNLALILCEQGRPAAAIPYYLRALALNPNSAPTNSQLGTAYLMSGDNAKAVEHFTRALQLNPAFTSARNNLGVLLLRSGRFEEARMQFETLVRLNGSNVGARWNLAVALAATRRYADAIQQFEAGLALDPNHVGLHNSYAEVLTAVGRSDLALQHLERSLQLNPSQSAVQEQRSRIRAELNDRPSSKPDR